jgi:succinate dehydrogenase/fumarate reductase flavoprotein subunit
MNNNGTHSVDYFQEIRKIMWDKVGMARNAQVEQSNEIAALKEFYKDVKVPEQIKVQSRIRKKRLVLPIS